MGTAVGTKVFVDGGYRITGAFCLALCGFQFLVLALRGPKVPQYAWIGWQGGLGFRKEVESPKTQDLESAFKETIVSPPKEASAEAVVSSLPQSNP